MTATQPEYHAAFTAAWQEIQHRINALPPFEQSMARSALKADMIQAVVNKAVDAALAATLTPPQPPPKEVEEHAED